MPLPKCGLLKLQTYCHAWADLRSRSLTLLLSEGQKIGVPIRESSYGVTRTAPLPPTPSGQGRTSNEAWLSSSHPTCVGCASPCPPTVGCYSSSSVSRLVVCDHILFLCEAYGQVFLPWKPYCRNHLWTCGIPSAHAASSRYVSFGGYASTACEPSDGRSQLPLISSFKPW